MTTVYRGWEYFGRLASSAVVVAATLVGQGFAQAPTASTAPAAQPHPRVRAPKPGVTTPGVVRPMTDLTPLASYTVEGAPDWSIAAGRALWVSSSRVNHVVQLLPGTGGKTGIVATVQRPCSGLAYGWGSVWTPSCGSHSLVRLDETTGKVIAEIPADPANSEGGITIGDGSVWMVMKPSTLVRVDPKTNTVVSKLELPSGTENPAFGDGFVWVSSFGHNALLKVDPKLNQVVATIPVGPQPRFLTVGAGSVWTLNQGDGTVSRVDMATGKVVATIVCGIPGEGGEITFGADSVWATMFEFPLTQIDPKTNLPVKQWKGKGGDGLRFGLGSLWLSNGRAGIGVAAFAGSKVRSKGRKHVPLIHPATPAERPEKVNRS